MGSGVSVGTMIGFPIAVEGLSSVILARNSVCTNRAPFAVARLKALNPWNHGPRTMCSEILGTALFYRGCDNFLGKGVWKVQGVRKVVAIDAAQEFDYENLKLNELRMKAKLKVGIVGFGNFGQFLAQRMVNQGHKVYAYSRSDYTAVCRKLGVIYFRDPDDFCEEHPDVVLLCTSILSTEAVLSSLPMQRLKRNTLFVDVLSVKEFPRNLFLKMLPAEFDILCTHPMFGPESGSRSWTGLPFVYEKVRIGGGSRNARCQKFLDIFGGEGCQMVEMSCKEHDRYAAGSQFITHTVGRVLGTLGLETTPINTKGYESLLKLVENTANDSFDLYYGLFLYNTNATEELQRLEQAFDSVKSQLFVKLHSVFRQQMLTARDAEVSISEVSTSTKFLTAQSSSSFVQAGADEDADSSSTKFHNGDSASQILGDAPGHIRSCSHKNQSSKNGLSY